MTDAPVFAIALPLIGALIAALWPRRGALIGIATATLTTAAALAAVAQVASGRGFRYRIGGWGAPLGIELHVDGLAVLLLGMSALVGLGVSVYARGYFRDGASARHFWPLWLLLWTALNGLFLAADLFNLYVTLELLGLSAVALAVLGGKPEALTAGLRYLIVGLLGSMVYLLGVALLYTRYGSLDLATLAAGLQPEPVAWVSLVLMTTGLLLKAALFPMHFWLPPAHANAPAPVSAVLSALVVKAAFYLVLRLWLDLFAPVIVPAQAYLLGALGAGAVLWGSWQALRAARLKLLAAYSTVAQIGYLFMAFPLLAALPAGPARQALLGGIVLLALTHGFAKASLFLAAGLVQQRAGHDRVADLDGTAQSMPATAFTIALAGVALIGLPPSGAFLGKWELITAAFAAGQWWWIVVIAIGTLLAAAYVFRILNHAFGHLPYPIRPVRVAGEEVPGLVLAALATVALGLFSLPLWALFPGQAGADLIVELGP